MSAPDRIWVYAKHDGAAIFHKRPDILDAPDEYLRADGPTITAYREALRARGVDPDDVAREAEKEAQNG